MPAQQHRPTPPAPQPAAPEAAQQQAPATSGSEEPEWDYALGAGNAMVLSLIAGNVAADDETAGSLLHGTTDVEAPETESEEASAPKAIVVEEPAADVGAAPPAPATATAAKAPPPPPPVAPATTNPGGTFSNPFKKHQAQVPKAKVTLTASQKAEIKVFQDNWVKNKARYESVSAKTGVPAELIAAIHYRESSLSFSRYLHQGDPLGKKAIHVPSNIPIFHEWEPAAIHALNMKKGIKDGLSMTEDTTDEVAMASYAESYNGLGYYNKGKTSPYVYAGTDQYTGGMYVADHKFSKVAKDRRLGVLALTRSIDENGATDVESGASTDKRTSEQVWGAVLSGHILRRGTNGREVRELQKRLNAAGYAAGVDGDFGAGTDKAVKKFQKDNGLEDDGVVGVDTAAAIDKKAPAAPPAPPAAQPGATDAPPASGPAAGPTPPAPTTGPAPATETAGPVTAPPAPAGPTTGPKTDTPATAPGEAAPATIPAPPEWAQVLVGRLLLERGAEGAVVRYLQSQLIKKGFTLDVDGDFGPATSRAIKAFQKANGIGVDGVVGKKTATALS